MIISYQEENHCIVLKFNNSAELIFEEEVLIFETIFAEKTGDKPNTTCVFNYLQLNRDQIVDNETKAY